MYANIRGADGESLGSVPVDPTKGDMQGQITAALAQMRAQAASPPILPSPPQARAPVFHHQTQSQPQSPPFVRPQLCYLQYPVVQGGKTRWMAQAMTCPPGVPPGHYVMAPRR